jgi:hypothetical protein
MTRPTSARRQLLTEKLELRDRWSEFCRNLVRGTARTPEASPSPIAEVQPAAGTDEESLLAVHPISLPT